LTEPKLNSKICSKVQYYFICLSQFMCEYITYPVISAILALAKECGQDMKKIPYKRKFLADANSDTIIQYTSLTQ
jgi:aspartate ammonia-lyase